jgi:hypothetical protein
MGTTQPKALAEVLASAEERRLTGTLTITSGSRTAVVYFIFGHAYHALCGTLSGEAVIQECLGWSDINTVFDKTAKLPTVETIARPLSQILAA